MRASGILMPVFSLCSDYGIGTLGEEAYNFVDFLKKSGQTYWQILPTGVTGAGNSPYGCYSAYAGNPLFIDLNKLCYEGYVERKELQKYDWGDFSGRVDYEKVKSGRNEIFKTVFENFKNSVPSDFHSFEKDNSYWLDDFALYFAIKKANGYAPFYEWEDKYKYRDEQALKNASSEYSDECLFEKMLQYFFFKQWKELKNYANNCGVKIIGDIPIYVCHDSADVWANPDLFLLDKNLMLTSVAGTPPDAFASEGQYWGNPLYNWENMANNGYSWWIDRIGFSLELCDIVRIDHFRGFSAYYSIPAGKKALDGRWVKGPGKQLFCELFKKYPNPDIIAEDLGIIDDDVIALLEFTKFYGMRVLQFAFNPNEESLYLPHNIPQNSVVYTGTHDNDTAVGFLNDAPKENVEFMRRYLRINEGDGFNWSFIKSAMATPAEISVFQMQDLLGLDNSARMNIPGKPKGNWEWRISKGCVNDWLAGILYDTTKTYCRVPEK